MGGGCVAGLAMGVSRGWGLRGIGPALAGKLAGAWAFALRARDECDRFQCSLRPDPAAAGNHQTLSRSLEGFGWRTIGGRLGYEKPRAARNRSWLAETRLDSPIDQPNVIHMETVTISPKFQIVIPQRIRESMGLRSGEKALILAFRNRMEIIPIRDVRALRGYLKGIDTSVVREGDQV